MFRLEDPDTGAPLSGLPPYLGAPAHVVILNRDGATFSHTNGEAAPGLAGAAPAAPAPSGAATAGGNPAATGHAGAYGSADHRSGDHRAASTTGQGTPGADDRADHGADGHAHAPAAGGYGPEIAFTHALSAPGLCKIWGQFQAQDGHVMTADFVVRVDQ